MDSDLLYFPEVDEEATRIRRQSTRTKRIFLLKAGTKIHQTSIPLRELQTRNAGPRSPAAIERAGPTSAQSPSIHSVSATRPGLSSTAESQDALPSLRYSGLPPAQPLRLALMDPTDRYLRAWKPVPSCPQFNQQRVLSRFFSLLLPLPTAVFSTIMAKRKATAEELEARAESNDYRREGY
jgi:hypothetical protein